jgi:hypothetical protein
MTQTLVNEIGTSQVHTLAEFSDSENTICSLRHVVVYPRTIVGVDAGGREQYLHS